MSELTEDEALELMQERFVGQHVAVPKTLSDNTIDYEVDAARMQGGRPELQIIPLDHNGQQVRVNKRWISLDEYRDKALAEDGDWTVTRA